MQGAAAASIYDRAAKRDASIVEGVVYTHSPVPRLHRLTIRSRKRISSRHSRHSLRERTSFRGAKGDICCFHTRRVSPSSPDKQLVPVPGRAGPSGKDRLCGDGDVLTIRAGRNNLTFVAFRSAKAASYFRGSERRRVSVGRSIARMPIVSLRRQCRRSRRARQAQ